MGGGHHGDWGGFEPPSYIVKKCPDSSVADCRIKRLSHAPPMHGKAAPLLADKARSAHVMSTLNKYPYACIIVFSHRSAAAVFPSIAKQIDTEQAKQILAQNLHLSIYVAHNCANIWDTFPIFQLQYFKWLN